MQAKFEPQGLVVLDVTAGSKRGLVCLLLLCLAALIMVPDRLYGQILETQRDTLITIYQATGGENWAQRDGWLEAESLCDWHGVQCRVSSTGVEQVRALDLE